MGRPTNAQTRPSKDSDATDVERYRDNWVRHLLGVAQDLEHRVLTRLENECGYDEVRPSLARFLSLVWHAPRPLTELAEGLGVSRQACGKLVRAAEQSGYVERVDSASRARAQQVRLTHRGRAVVDDAVRMIIDAETAYAERIGEDELRRFIAAAASLFSGLGLQDQTDPAAGEAARRSIGVLPLIAQRVEEALREKTRAKGHDVLQLSHARLIALIGHQGARVSEMARHQGVSRQATSATVRSLESLGYARREADPSDGRGVHVVLTRRGKTLIRDSLRALEELSQEFRGILGARRFNDLLRMSAALHADLQTKFELLPVVRFDLHAPTGAPRQTPVPGTQALREIATHLEQQLGKEAAQKLGALLARGSSN